VRCFGRKIRGLALVCCVLLPAAGAQADVLYLVNFSDAQLERVSEAIAPARLYTSLGGHPHLRGEVEAVHGIDENLRIRFEFRAWWRQSSGDKPVWSRDAVEFNLPYAPGPVDTGGNNGQPDPRRFHLRHELDNTLDLRLVFSDVDQQVGPIGSAPWRAAVAGLLDPDGELGLPGASAEGVERAALRRRGWFILESELIAEPSSRAALNEAARRMPAVRRGEVDPKVLPLRYRAMAVDPFALWTTIRNDMVSASQLVEAIERSRILHGEEGKGFRQRVRRVAGFLDSLAASAGSITLGEPSELSPVQRRRNYLAGFARSFRRQLIDTATWQSNRARLSYYYVFEEKVDAERLVNLLSRTLFHEAARAPWRREMLAEIERIRQGKAQIAGYPLQMWPAEVIRVEPGRRVLAAQRIILDHCRWDQASFWKSRRHDFLVHLLDGLLDTAGRATDDEGRRVADSRLLAWMEPDRAMARDLRQSDNFWTPEQLGARRLLDAVLRSVDREGRPPLVTDAVAALFQEELPRSLFGGRGLSRLDGFTWLLAEADAPRQLLSGRALAECIEDWLSASMERRTSLASNAYALTLSAVWLARATDGGADESPDAVRDNLAEPFSRAFAWQLASLAPEGEVAPDPLIEGDRDALDKARRLARSGLETAVRDIAAAADVTQRRQRVQECLNRLLEAGRALASYAEKYE